MADYEFILCHSPSNDKPFDPLVKIGTLDGAKQRQYQLVKNRAGSASFQLRTTDDMAYEILDNVDLNDVRGTVRKCIRIRRNKQDIWSGPIWGITGSLPDGLLSINCVGWLERLQHRILWQTLDYSENGLGLPSDQIIFGILDAVNAQAPQYPTFIQPGSVTGYMPNRNRFYVLGTVVGPTIQELSDIESGIDYSIDPITREMNLSAWNSFATHENVHLGYQWGPNNIKNLQWQESADKICNYMGVISQGAPVYAFDPDAVTEYGLFEEYNTLTGANQEVLLPYAQAEMVIRSRPLVTYNVTPFPRALTGEGGPSLFDDFQMGDVVYMTARQGAFQINHQAIRIFGASISLDDNDNETISNLQLTPGS